MFGHQERDIAVRHGDDYLSSADIEDLRWQESMLKKMFDITTDIFGRHDGEKQEADQRC